MPFGTNNCECQRSYLVEPTAGILESLGHSWDLGIEFTTNQKEREKHQASSHYCVDSSSNPLGLIVTPSLLLILISKVFGQDSLREAL